MQSNQPIFSAVSTSARQLHSLLKCIAFTDKVQVQIAEDGLRFSSGESSVMEGAASVLVSMSSAIF